MAALDDEKYHILVDSLVSNYIKRFGDPPGKDKDLDAYTNNMFSHYVNNPDKFAKFVNRIPIDLPNIQIIDKTGRSLFIDIRSNITASHNKNKDKRIVRYNGTLEPPQISQTNRYALYLLLRHDFKESAKRQKLRDGVQSGQSKNIKKETTPSGTLEKDFKAMAVKGQAADVLAAFKTIVQKLSPGSQADLGDSLKSSGVYTARDLESLLNRWKTEAQQSIRQKPEHTQTRTISQSPSIGL
jgi:hypothetical protein